MSFQRLSAVKSRDVISSNKNKRPARKGWSFLRQKDKLKVNLLALSLAVYNVVSSVFFRLNVNFN